MAKINRVPDNAFLQDPSSVTSIEYNQASGGQKSLIVGPRLLPIPISGSFTTNASAGIILPQLGMILAVYNNASAVASIVISPAVAASLAPGVCDVNGNVGVALPANSWTYLSASFNQYVITSAATVLVYSMEDPTRLAQITGPYAQQNVPGTQLPINS